MFLKNLKNLKNNKCNNTKISQLKQYLSLDKLLFVSDINSLFSS